MVALCPIDEKCVRRQRTSEGAERIAKDGLSGNQAPKFLYELAGAESVASL